MNKDAACDKHKIVKFLLAKRETIGKNAHLLPVPLQCHIRRYVQVELIALGVNIGTKVRDWVA